MQRLIVFRASFNLSKFIANRLDPSWIQERLDIFIRYTYPCLLQQTNQNFYYLLEHDSMSTSTIQTKLAPINLPSHILPTTNAHMTISQLLTNYDELYLVNVSIDSLFSTNYVAQLTNYIPHPKTRVLTFESTYAYNIETHKLTEFTSHPILDFTFICPKLEYLTYFKTYDTFFPTTLTTHFLKMPHEVITPLPLLLLIHAKTLYPSYATHPLSSDPSTIQTILSHYCI